MRRTEWLRRMWHRAFEEKTVKYVSQYEIFTVLGLIELAGNGLGWPVEGH